MSNPRRRSVSLLFLLGLIALHGCNKADQKDKSMTKYIKTLDPKFCPREGKIVLIFSNTNGCVVCVNATNEIRQTLNDPRIRFIYSIERKDLLDKNLFRSMEVDGNVLLDYNHTPYRKGFVTTGPVIYFISNSKIEKQRELTGFPVYDLKKAIDDFIPR